MTPPRTRPPVITIDGPAGSGKSTTAREVARRLGYRHLDSGALYRALTFALLKAGIPPGEWEEMTPEDLEKLNVAMKPTPTGFHILVRGREVDAELRSPEVTRHVSGLARLPAVRGWLLSQQRDAGREGGLVADGRDMGSVVFPDADLKIFLTADLHERARRRLRDEGKTNPTPEEVEEEAVRIEARDRTDAGRALSPLVRPEGAWVLDTTSLSFEEQVDAIVRRAQSLTQS
ncbi:MAG: (d)CMP kinase [Gemmatimonadota bacterium]